MTVEVTVNGKPVTHTGSSRQRQQSTEMLDLNRAILLSLQEAPAALSTTHSASGSHNNSISVGISSDNNNNSNNNDIATVLNPVSAQYSEAAEALVAMGFERGSVERALAVTQGDADAAADILLSGG